MTISDCLPDFLFLSLPIDKPINFFYMLTSMIIKSFELNVEDVLISKLCTVIFKIVGFCLEERSLQSEYSSAVKISDFLFKTSNMADSLAIILINKAFESKCQKGLISYSCALFALWSFWPSSFEKCKINIAEQFKHQKVDYKLIFFKKTFTRNVFHKTLNYIYSFCC
jgi:hypothetical protein